MRFQELNIASHIGTLVYELNMSNIRQRLLLPGKAETPILVFDEKGQSIFVNPTQRKMVPLNLNRKDLFITLENLTQQADHCLNGYYLYTGADGWCYLLPTDPSLLSISWERVLITFLPAFLLLTLVGLVLAWYISRVIYQPTDHLMRVVGANRDWDNKKQRNEVDFLESAYSLALEEQAQLHGIVSDIAPEILESMLKNLLIGKHLTQERVGEILRGINDPILVRGRFFVIACQMVPDERRKIEDTEINLYLLAIRNLVNRLSDENGKIYDIRTDVLTLGLICCYPENCSLSYLSQMSGKIQQTLQLNTQAMPFQLFCARGKIYPDLLDVRYSYREAMEKVRHQQYFRNTEGKEENLLGVSVQKKFIPSIANIVGTDLSNYKIVRTGQFAYGPVTSRNGEKISIAYLDEEDYIISSSYTVFEVENKEELDPEYLMLWFSRPEFDRYARYKSHGSVREIFDWNELCMVELPVPDIEKQRKIVKAYKTLTDRIALKQQINDNLANTEQAILVETVINNHTVPTALGDLVDFIDGDRGKNYPTFDEFTSTGYCLFLNASNVTSTGFNFDNCMFVSEEKDKLMNKGHLSPYDIVLTSRGTLGNVALYDKHIKYENVRINSGMLIIRPKTKRLSPYFIYALLKSSYMKAAIERFKSGSAQPQLPIKDLQKITFEIPESDTVLVALDRQFLAVEESISINNNEIGNLKELSNVLLAELSR